MLAIIAPVSAGTIHVYPGGDIKAIIEGAPAGSTIYVHAGTYPITTKIIINKDNITLIGDGASSTILQGNNKSDYIIQVVLANNVSISGFTFTQGSSGIYANLNNHGVDMNNGKIFNNIFENNYNGIQVAGHDETDLSKYEIFNNLIVSNGTGINLFNFDASTVSNNTIVSNTNYGIMIQNKNVSNIKNNIVVSNVTGILCNNNDSTPTLTYNNVWNNTTNYSFIPAGLTPGTGSISKDPLFATGRLGTYYLSTSSPCVDSGSTSAASLGLDKMTTRTDEQWDTGTVDMGYHYVSNRLEKKGFPIEFILKILKGNKNN